MLECCLVWFCAGLLQTAIAVRVHEHSDPVISWRRCFTLVLPDLWLAQSFHLSFHDGPWALWGGEWYRCLLVDEHFTSAHSLHFDYLWVNNHSPLNKETSLMRSETSSNLWVEKQEFRGQFNSASTYNNSSRFTPGTCELPSYGLRGRLTVSGMCFLLKLNPKCPSRANLLKVWFLESICNSGTFRK